MDKMRKYFKIRKYVHRKIGIWKLKHAVKFFFDIDNETIEELKIRYQKEETMMYLSYLVWNWVIGKNPYEEKAELTKPEHNQWIKNYIDNIYLLTEDDIDLVFYVIKQI